MSGVNDKQISFPMIIDAWAQHPTLRHMRDPIFSSLNRWSKREAPTEDMPVELTIAAMDEAGVNQSLISAWSAPGNEMISNDEVAGFIAQAPNRLIGVGSVDISKPVKAVEDIRRCVNELGFVGIRVLPWLWERPPTDPLFYPVYATCCELDVPFCTQIGHTGPLMSSEVGRPIYLDRVALDFPELKIVGGHIGYPWTEEAIAVATKHENVFIDTSAYSIKRYPAEIIRYLKTNGKNKVMFGTNYPMMTPAQALADLAKLDLDESTKTAFLSGNTKRVFKLNS